MNQDKLARFMHDVAMQEAVREALEAAFRKQRHTDVHMLAASRLALDYLDDAWRELEQFKHQPKSEARGVQVGL